MNWPQMIKGIINSGIPTEDGKKWSYRHIAKAVGLSKAQIGRLALGQKEDPYFTPGKKLVDLYLKITKEAQKRGPNTIQ